MSISSFILTSTSTDTTCLWLIPPEMVRRVRDAYSRLLEREELEGLKSEKRSKIRDFYGVMEGVKNCR